MRRSGRVVLALAGVIACRGTPNDRRAPCPAPHLAPIVPHEPAACPNAILSPSTAIATPTSPWPAGFAPACRAFASVWLGTDHGCATCEDGTVTCWGASGGWADPGGTIVQTLPAVTDAIAATDQCVLRRSGAVGCYRKLGAPLEPIALPARATAIGTG